MNSCKSFPVIGTLVSCSSWRKPRTDSRNVFLVVSNCWLKCLLLACWSLICDRRRSRAVGGAPLTVDMMNFFKLPPWAKIVLSWKLRLWLFLLQWISRRIIENNKVLPSMNESNKNIPILRERWSSLQSCYSGNVFFQHYISKGIMCGEDFFRSNFDSG